MPHCFLENRYQDGSWECLSGEIFPDRRAAILRAELLSRDAISYGMVRAIHMAGDSSRVCLAEFSAGHLPYDIVFTADGFQVVPIQVQIEGLTSAIAMDPMMTCGAIVGQSCGYDRPNPLHYGPHMDQPAPYRPSTPPTQEELRPARGIRIRNQEGSND